MEAPFWSKLLRAYDYHNVDLEPFCVPFETDEEALDESLLSVRKKYAVLKPAEKIENGDFATITCRSDKAKFQKDSITVCVGKNLYSKELEEKLTGLSTGETAEVEAEGAPVIVTVGSVQRSVLPELTDEFTDSAFETISTVSELKEWYINEQREVHIKTLAAQAAEQMTEETAEKSEICLDEQERLAARATGEKVLREHWRFNGVELDRLSDKEAEEMVTSLANLFRISISKGHEMIPIEKELQHARSYLKIEKIRYKDQFTYHFDVDESCLGYLCNKITLQPIIENAIYHGVNQMPDEGKIDIRIFSKEDDIIFQIEDNGVGMTEEMCREILQRESGDRTGIGIKNVNDRIKIYFGEEYGITIASELDEGTCVTIRMPKIKEDKYEK